MSNYAYVAVDPHGLETRGTLESDRSDRGDSAHQGDGLVPHQALRNQGTANPNALRLSARAQRSGWRRSLPGLGGKVKFSTLTVFTRQLSTLIEAGMPLLRSLRTLQQQEENRVMRQVLDDLAYAIEDGSSFAEALAAHPRVFNRLFVNMVKAGEMGGALEITLGRLADCMEKAKKIKGKVKAALFYPCRGAGGRHGYLGRDAGLCRAALQRASSRA